MHEFIAKYQEQHESILQWIEEKYPITDVIEPPLNSIDIRHAGFKIAHVDSNLFPGGFHNLAADNLLSAAKECLKYFEHYYPSAQRIALYPEQFTRNAAYQINLAQLQVLLEKAGKKVTFIVQDDLIQDFIPANKVAVGQVRDADYDVIMLNNDLTAGIPEFLQKTELPILPDPALGWHARSKSTHFEAYDQIAAEVASKFQFDPWLISTYTSKCRNIDFRERKNLECIAIAVDKTIHKIKNKYEQYSIKATPFVFVKADRGTFGLGIMAIKDGQEIFHINKKQRHTMQKIKLGVENSHILIQEGVPTIETIDNFTAESMVYSVNRKPIGAFKRFNQNKDSESNLNSQGMGFTKSTAVSRADPQYLISQIACIANVLEAKGLNRNK